MKNQKTNKKVARKESSIFIIFTLIMIAVIIVATVWLSINYDAIKKGVDGTKLYTQEEIAEAYNKGVQDKAQFEQDILYWQNEYEDIRSELNEQLSSKVTMINNLQNDINLLQSRVNGLQEQVSSKTSIIDNQQNNINSLQSRINELQEQVSSKTNEISSLMQTLADSVYFNEIIGMEFKLNNDNSYMLTNVDYDIESVVIPQFVFEINVDGVTHYYESVVEMRGTKPVTSMG